MSDEWYYKLRGKVYGPLPFASILEKGRCGELSLDDAIRQGTAGEWVCVSSIAALFPNLKSAGSGVASETSDAGIDLEEFQDLSELDFESSEPAEPAAAPARTSDLADLSALEREVSDRVQEAEPPTASTLDTILDGEPGWYCQVLGSELGPMSFDDLKSMAEHNELSPDDSVKHGARGPWAPAEQVDDLFCETLAAEAGPAPNGSVPDLDEFEFVEKISDAISESEAASPLIETTVPAESERTDSQRAADAEPPLAVQPTPVVQPEPAAEQAAGVKATLGGGPGSSPSEMQTPLGSVSETLRRARLKAVVCREPARPRRRRAEKGFESWLSQVPLRVKWGAAVAVALIVVVVMFVSFGGSDQEYYETYTAIWNKHKELRSRSASDDEWSSFNQEVKRQLEPIIHDLNRTASAKRPIKQHLLWAGRDYLPLMIVDARESPSEAEELFAQHMDDARLLLAGEKPQPPIDGIGETDNARPSERGDFAGEESPRAPTN